METKIFSLTEFMSSAKSFWVPLYQRNFNWKEKQFEDLIADITSLLDSKNSIHYFGPIVLLKKERANFNGEELSSIHSSNTYEIIDGQQRITTVYIFLLSIRRNRKIKLPNEIASQINQILYIKEKNIKEEKDNYKKLFLHGSDDIDLDNLIHDGSLSSLSNGCIKNCFSAFSNFLNIKNDEGVNIDDIFAALTNLQVAVIKPTDKDDPQIIYDRINTSGLLLSNFDKIKNHIYWKYNRDDQSIIDSYFEVIQQVTGSYSDSAHMDTFLIIFHMSFFHNQVKSNIYQCYREKIDSFDDDKLLNFVEVLAEYAFLYARYIAINICINGYIYKTIKSPFSDAFLNLQLSQDVCILINHFRSFQFAQLYPFILKKIYEYSLNQIDSESLKESLYKSLIFSMTILGNNGNLHDYNKLCMDLINPRGALSENAVKYNMFSEIELTRKKRLFLKYLLTLCPESNEKNKLEFSIDHNDNQYVFIPKELNENFQEILNSNSECQIPASLSISIQLPNQIEEDVTRKKPYYATINGYGIDISSWKQLKIECIMRLLKEEYIFKKLLDIKRFRIPGGRYVYVSLDNEFDDDSLQIDINNQKIYINTKSQNANSILKVIKDIGKQQSITIDCM